MRNFNYQNSTSRIFSKLNILFETVANDFVLLCHRNSDEEDHSSTILNRNVSPQSQCMLDISNQSANCSI